MATITPQGATTAICWKYIKILSNDDELFTQKKHTHKCILCDWSASIAFLKPGKKMTVSYYTSQPNRHLFGSHLHIPEIAALKISRTETKVKNEKEVENKLLSSHVSSASSTVPPPPQKRIKMGNIDSFYATTNWRDEALCKQAHWFLYSTSSLPISIFRDNSFKSMMAAMIPKTFKYEGKPPILTECKLKIYINAEYEIMKKEIHNLVGAKHRLSQGNSFSQLIHDGTTLPNGTKVQSIGIQLLDLQYRRNFCICLCSRE